MSEIPSGEKQEVSKEHKHELEIEGSREQVEEVRRVVAEVIQSEFSGPIPPPSISKGYEEVLPGAADRIISMAEKQSQHRQHMEKEMIRIESRDSLLGIIFAFGLGIGCVVAAIVMSVVVPQSAGVIAGSVLGIAGISSIIATFIKSTRNNYRGNREKDSTQSGNNP